MVIVTHKAIKCKKKTSKVQFTKTGLKMLRVNTALIDLLVYFVSLISLLLDCQCISISWQLKRMIQRKTRSTLDL